MSEGRKDSPRMAPVLTLLLGPWGGYAQMLGVDVLLAPLHSQLKCVCKEDEK